MEHLAIFHWFSKYNFVCIPVLAFLLDLIIGDPNSKYHPVAIIGRIISFFEAVLYKDTDNDTKKLWYGGIAVGLILISVYIIVSLLLWLGGVVDEWVYYAFEVVILYIAISPRSLAGAGFTISQLIKQGNIVDARKRLSWIVGRDTEDLDEKIGRMAKGAVTKVGTGGMETKIAAANIVTDAGADMVIVNSNNLNNVNKVVAGEEIGTLFLAHKRPDFDFKKYLTERPYFKA